MDVAVLLTEGTQGSQRFVSVGFRQVQRTWPEQAGVQKDLLCTTGRNSICICCAGLVATASPLVHRVHSLLPVTASECNPNRMLWHCTDLTPPWPARCTQHTCSTKTKRSFLDAAVYLSARANHTNRTVRHCTAQALDGPARRLAAVGAAGWGRPGGCGSHGGRLACCSWQRRRGRPQEGGGAGQVGVSACGVANMNER